jgi:isochorismate synthase
MPQSDILLKLIELLIQKAFPFAVYQYPDSDVICVVAQREKIHLVHDIKEICSSNGFLISPFESARTGEGYFINADLFACDKAGFEVMYKKIKDAGSDSKLLLGSLPKEMTREEYLEMTGNVIQKLRSKQFDKVVVSRVKSIEREEDFFVADFFLKLTEKYPGAFVYLFLVPDSGMWVGATPETLISQKKNGDAVIMSLAGTLPVEEGKEIKWEEKEIVEQQYVSDFIRLRLTELGIRDYIEEPTKTIFAGKMAHLQTIFKVPANQVERQLGDLVKGLHPTPAVCGLPKADAFQLIEHAELHERRFYTGYLGPWRLDGKSDLFVNLRCAEITEGKINLYVGGGLTADSNPEKEWEETELKAGTLLSVLEEREI